MTTYSWASSSSGGAWSGMGNWTPTGVPNAQTDEADFPATYGDPYTVTVDTGPYELDTLHLDDPNAELDVLGTLVFDGIDNILALNQGTLLLDSGGVIQSATVQFDADNALLAVNGGTFDGVTWQGELDIPDGATLTTVDGLTVENDSGSLPGVIVLGSNASLSATGGLTVGDPGSQGSIVVDGDASSITFGDDETLDDVVVSLRGFNDSIDAESSTLTIGRDAVLALTGGDDVLYDSIVNKGTIALTAQSTSTEDNAGASTFDNQASITVAGGAFYIENSAFTNEGSIVVGSDGLLAIGGAAGTVTAFNNTGSIVVESGGELDLQYDITVADLDATSGIDIETGATLGISGELGLGGSVLALGAGAFATVDLVGGGTIADGTLGIGGGSFTVNDGTLDALTFLGALLIPTYGTLVLLNGVTVENSAGSLPGTITIGNYAGLTITGGVTVGEPGDRGTIQMLATHATLSFEDSEELDDAVIEVGGGTNTIVSADTLTLGADTTLSLSGAHQAIEGDIVNLGTLAVVGTARYDLTTPSGTFDNKGLLSVSNGMLYFAGVAVSNEGSIEIGPGGKLYVDEASSLSNTGSVSVESGGTLALMDNSTLAELKSFTFENGSTLTIEGTLDLGGGLMNLDQFGTFVLTGGNPIGGTIFDGTVVAAGGTTYFENGGALEDVVYQGNLEIGAGQSLSSEDLTVENAAGLLPGTIILDTGALFQIYSGELVLGTPGHQGAILVQGDTATVKSYFPPTLSDMVITLRGNDDALNLQQGMLAADSSILLSGTGEHFYASFGFTNFGSIRVTGGSTEIDTGNHFYDNRGSISVDNGRLILDNTAGTAESSFTNEGEIDVGGGGTLMLGVLAFGANTAIITVGDGGTLEIAAMNLVDAVYDDPALVILDSPSSFTGSLTGLSRGDELQLNGETIEAAIVHSSILKVTLTNGGTLAYSTAAVADGTTFSISTGSDGYDDLLTVTCFLAGTRIATERGAIPVEDLREGECVETSGGARAPIRWIGRRRIDTARHPRPESCWPIRIRRDAIAPNKPRRDLLLSPDHALLLDGVLVPAKLLVNGMTIVQEQRIRHVDYFHVELDHHAVLLAEGLETESYLDTGNRAIFENAGLAVILYPAFADQTRVRDWSIHACAPLGVAPDIARPIWQRIAARAMAAFGFVPPTAAAITTDPDLYLAVGGRRLRPVAATPDGCAFVLPRGATSAVLRSRAASAAALEPFHADRRALGVAVRRLCVHLREPGCIHEIAMDAPCLTEGWWAPESAHDALWRWTDGAASIPLPSGATMLSLAFHGTHRYPLAAHRPDMAESRWSASERAG